MTNQWQFFRFVSAVLIVINTALGQCFPWSVPATPEVAKSKAILKSITALLLFMQLFQALVI
eukprot:CAMPEP_0173387334 /NCGR_PEP_ID=MMETSP1356-20130122/9857_1 /TAXON_ID=77927 ORGANISM="Hemiselmis virescens, Strain PCC157" /NCGR_SAMPLE_ID=MMETSP1356 /ASSEMBLY_ACC=CAM_ASM_000847 /LENGTH=61 /DNA_ID=CAMNT_0014343911 /DNA_START=1 /DNA_END=183 /DNA_ORIENTATION=+